jgi:hypothetical protein
MSKGERIFVVIAVLVAIVWIAVVWFALSFMAMGDLLCLSFGAGRGLASLF